MMFQTAILALLIILPAEGPSARERLAENVGRAIENLDALTFEVDLHVEAPQILRALDTMKNHDVHLSVTMKDGGKFRVEAVVEDQRLWMFLSDGQEVFEWVGKENAWTRYPLRPPESDMVSCVRGLLIADATVVNCFGNPEVDERYGTGRWLRKIVALPQTKLLGRRKLDGRDCVVVENKEITYQDDSAMSHWTSETFRIYFDPDTHLVCRQRIIVSFGVGPLRLGSSTVDVRRRRIVPNPELPDDLFRFTPPEGSTFIPTDAPRFFDPTFEGKPAPELSLPDLEGRTFSLADLKGQKAALVVFWATWCGPCNVEMPTLIKLHAEFNGQGLAIIGVSSDSSLAALKTFVARKRLPYLILHDAADKASKAYGAKSIPRTFLIDKTGTVVRDWKGWSGEEEEKQIREELAKVLSGPTTTAPAD